jgi:peptidoglycan hydrolase CwlO-like protein
MKEFITIAVAFFLVIALSFYMYISNSKSNSSMVTYEKLQIQLEKDNEQLKFELNELKNHISKIDSIYHK